MASRSNHTNFFSNVYSYLVLIISMSGFVPKHASASRIFAITISGGVALYFLIFQPLNSNLATFYFLLSEFFYISFLIVVLSKNGLRHWFVKKWGSENEGYLAYEAVLSLLFFHNLVSIGYVASANPGNLFHFVNQELLSVIILIMFVGGFLVKILSAKAVSIEIYYCKDMFLGRKISDFVVTGPYKYISNPMYGVGQLQAYATALWYNSELGLIAAVLNQLLVFTFYYTVEKKFIQRTYLNLAFETNLKLK